MYFNSKYISIFSYINSIIYKFLIYFVFFLYLSISQANWICLGSRRRGSLCSSAIENNFIGIYTIQKKKILILK